MTVVSRTALIVLGMHRSGTSALTRVLSLHGADLPATLMPPGSGNETGFWESEAISGFNDALLESLCSSWSDWSRVEVKHELPSVTQMYRHRAAELVEQEFGASTFFILKDPRLCRLASFWVDVLERAGIRTKFILSIRDPLEVAASLERRDGLPVDVSIKLWLRHILDAEEASRGKIRTVVEYSELLRDWRASVSRIAHDIALPVAQHSSQKQEEVDSFLNLSLRHYSSSINSYEYHDRQSQLAGKAYTLLSDWKENEEAWGSLGQIRTEFERGSFPGAAKAKIAALTRSALHAPRDISRIVRGKRKQTKIDEFLKHSNSGINTIALPVNGKFLPKKQRIAVVIHCYYVQLIKEFLSILSNSFRSADLLISTDSQEKANFIKSETSRIPSFQHLIRITQNRGRDIPSKLIIFDDLYTDYDVILFLHTKRSGHKNSLLRSWRSYLTWSLCGRYDMTESFLHVFSTQPSVGMIGVEHFEGLLGHTSWDVNADECVSLAARMGCQIRQDANLEFPSGSMFWCRPQALQPLLDLKLDLDDFPEEAGHVDGTIAHAIERMFYLSCELAGYRWLKACRAEYISHPQRPTRVEGHVQLTDFVESKTMSLLSKAKLSDSTTIPD